MTTILEEGSAIYVDESETKRIHLFIKPYDIDILCNISPEYIEWDIFLKMGSINYVIQHEG